MMLLRTVAPWLLLAFLGQQVCLSSGGRGAVRASSTAGGSGPKGKFNTKDKMQCEWFSKDEGDSTKVRVKCVNPEAFVKGGVTERRCDYLGKPQRCPGYRSDPKGFWKQVSRAFKRLQGKVCQDERALVRAGMCKRAPRDAHFMLDVRSSVASAQSGGDPSYPPAPSTVSSSTGAMNCSSRAEQQKTAEEYCSSHWASVCFFFLSILQSEDC